MSELSEQLNKVDEAIISEQKQKVSEKQEKFLPFEQFLGMQDKVVANPDLARKQLGETCLDVLNIIAQRIKYKYSVPLLPGEEVEFNITDAKICKDMLDVTEYTGRKQDVPVSQINVKKQLVINVQQSAKELENVLKDVVDI